MKYISILLIVATVFILNQVSSGRTGHLEVVQITYDPEKISYCELLEVYWRQFDPTDAGGSFVDRGSQYTSGVFYHNEQQKRGVTSTDRLAHTRGRPTRCCDRS